VSWSVKISNKAGKTLVKLPKNIRTILGALVLDIRATGPVRGDWQNYSKLADGSR
jgi:mRNA-degrading endonuclease RelE of RelBE toxin-antitoxin system